MRLRLADLVVFGGALLLASLVLVAEHQGPSLSPDRASWRLTPGVLNPTVTQASIAQTICRAGWTRTVRPPSTYTSALKIRQMDAYRRRGDPSDFQEDHLISLELGGHPTDPRNLWPEPRPRADQVDGIENDLNAAVCSGRMTLAEAQRREAELKHTAG
ncbi:MAG: hypothetical protein E6G67_05015 [Actinobacteria bacterium]|nr:MAG: hypothetical protein E6G67_05015 [Actinomycetota bacterium]